MMLGRRLDHWSPAYLRSRLVQIFYEQRNPNAPWLTPDMIKILDSCLRSSDIGMELGSGRSTLWFAKRIAHLTSIEHDESFYHRTFRALDEAGIRNVDYRLCQAEVDYLSSIAEREEASLDFALIDGKHRAKCVLFILSKLKPGALLVVDNSECYLTPPRDACSKAPMPLTKVPPPGDWELASELLRDWRCLWTTNGVWDSALYMKPLA